MEKEEAINSGYAALLKSQFQDAKTFFEAALKHDPKDTKALQGLSSVYRSIIPQWHFVMLGDAERNSAFDIAIQSAVNQDSVVLDIGSGTGLLAMMAVRAGAKHVYSCEVVPEIAAMAKQIVAENNLQDRITIIPKISHDVTVGSDGDMPERADILITETVDCALVGEGIIPTIHHAKSELLKANARLIPQGAKLYAALIESEEVHRLNYVASSNVTRDFNLQSFNHFSPLNYIPLKLRHYKYRFLCRPFELLHFNFNGNNVIKPKKATIPIDIRQDGKCHAVVFWWDMQLSETINISNTIDNTTTHWDQAVHCFKKPKSFTHGDSVTLHASYLDTMIDFTIA